MVLDQNGPCINTFQTIIKNVCLSVILEFCLLSVFCYLCSVVCNKSAAYPSVCTGLEYLLKVKYTTLVDPNEAVFLIFETVFLDWSMSEKYITKMSNICVW